MKELHYDFLKKIYEMLTVSQVFCIVSTQNETVYGIYNPTEIYNEYTNTSDYYEYDLVRVWNEKDGLHYEVISTIDILKHFSCKAHYYHPCAMEFTEEDELLL